LLISVSDHETGGLTIGMNQPGLPYPEYVWHPSIVKNVRRSTTFICNLVLSKTVTIKVAMQDFAQITLTEKEEQFLESVFVGPLNSTYISGVVKPAIGKVISDRAFVSWSTIGHTAVDINVYAKGYHSTYLKGNLNNIDISRFVSDTFKLPLSEASDRVRHINPNPSPNDLKESFFPH